MAFDLQNPGPKEYAIAAGGALGIFFLWQWWSKRQASQASAAGQGQDTGQPGVVSTSPTGLSLAALLLWLQDHSSSSTTTTTTTSHRKHHKRPTSIVASGKDPGDINQIAHEYGLTETQLINANPELRKMKVRVGKRWVPLIGSGAPVPGGTHLVIPVV